MRKYFQYYLFVILGIIGFLLIDKFLGWVILILLIIINYDKFKNIQAYKNISKKKDLSEKISDE